MTHQEGQACKASPQGEHPRIHYIQRRFAGERTLEKALVSLMRAHSAPA